MSESVDVSARKGSGSRGKANGTARKRLPIERVWTTEGVHPYEEVTWERRDVVMTNWRDGSINFEQRGVEFPESWSLNATNIVTSKYFRGAVGTKERESSLKQLIGRVVKTYRDAGEKHGYFDSPKDAQIFEEELTWLLLHQYFSFNSPVWFNVGTPSRAQVSACFILSVEDSMDSILEWYKEEGSIFKGGSGSGINLSQIRSSKELLSSGGNASGPVSFMRGADASAGTIKSGGATRRAAKMVVLDVDHPDIEEFIDTKAREEDKIRALRDAGFDMDLGGKDIVSVQYQNANNSVRVSDEFMKSVEEGTDFALRGRMNGEAIEYTDAKALFRKMSQAAWECADPGIQYDDTINDWHTNPETGKITSSNPCCFTGDTLVVTEDGPVAFELLHKRLEAGDTTRVLSRDLATGDFCFRPVVRSWVAGLTSDLMEVTVEDGSRLRCTPEHRFLTDTGWVAAEELRQGMKLVSRSSNPSVVASRRIALEEAIEVFDMEIEETHNFVVTSEGREGVVAHNSEYMHIDDSSCNLASLNLLKFRNEDGSFDSHHFVKAVEFVITAMEISISFADFPTDTIGKNTRAHRQLGIGYANLGALLMASGFPYNSDSGRAVAASITSLMTAVSYRRSAEIAAAVGPYEAYPLNAEPHKRVMRKHAAACDDVKTHAAMDRDILQVAAAEWEAGNKLGDKHGWRNAQASVIAPTGTIGFALDCDTTGIEPDLALVKYKKLVGGGSMQIVNQTVPRALRTLGYHKEQIEAITEFIAEHGHVIGAPGLREEHYPVFDCAMGERSISPMGHVKMMAAVQPFVSGAISKTVNVPESASVEDFEKIYFEAWKLGLKALAVYRENSKVGQPLSVSKSEKEEAEPVVEYRPVRTRLPKRRSSQTVSFSVGGAEGYMTSSSYPDNRVGEVFFKMSKQGSTLAGIMDAFSVAISIALQYGVPLEKYVEKFTNMRFEPAGMTDDPDIRMAASVVDYLFRRLALDYLPFETRSELGIMTAAERTAEARGDDPAQVHSSENDVDFAALASSAPIEKVVEKLTEESPQVVSDSSTEILEKVRSKAADAPLCMTCGTKMRPAGSCYVCEGCGSTSGCS